jgi:PPOX class probable F420-dependent enzyme
MENLKPEIEALLAQKVLARLATADKETNQPHVVPVWFEWDGQSVWISSYSNTRKIKELRANPACSILVDTDEHGGQAHAVIFEGKAELVRGPKDWLRQRIEQVYIKYLGPQGVLDKAPQEWLEDPHNLLVKLTPDKVYSW